MKIIKEFKEGFYHSLDDGSSNCMRRSSSSSINELKQKYVGAAVEAAVEAAVSKEQELKQKYVGAREY